MNAIVVTEEQAAALPTANEGSILTLEPRGLQDGRLILNADILDDPYFADPSRPWAAILAGEQIIVEEPHPGQTGEVALEVEAARDAITKSLAQVRAKIVTLSPRRPRRIMR
jgi:hypothetical protein